MATTLQTPIAAQLQEAGWSVGRNVVIELRWGAGDTNRFRSLAAELVALEPDVVLAAGAPVAQALQGASRTVPIAWSGNRKASFEFAGTLRR